jgi:hypothetical protein
MNVDFTHFNELLDLVSAQPATNHDAGVVRYHLGVLVSMPSIYSNALPVDGVPELVEIVMRVDDRTYGVFLGFTASGRVLRAYGYWRDPGVAGHRRDEALGTARNRYWEDHFDG